jgi:hypothetical protein
MQYPLTTGTIYVGSHLPLMTWFDLVSHVVCVPELATRHIAQRVGTRARTVTKAISKIKTALASDAADTRLAGVHRQVLVHLRKAHRDGAFPVSKERLGEQAENQNQQGVTTSAGTSGRGLPAESVSNFNLEGE